MQLCIKLNVLSNRCLDNTIFNKKNTMKTLLLSIILLFTLNSYSQISAKNQTGIGGYFLAKEYSAKITESYAEKYMIDKIIDLSELGTQYKIDALVASNSGELTTVYYQCKSQNKEGLILGFYGDYWNENGVTFKSHSFTHLDVESAKSFLNKLDNLYDENSKALFHGIGAVGAVYGDFKVILKDIAGVSPVYRIFWNGFDAEWKRSELIKTIRRLESK